MKNKLLLFVISILSFTTVMSQNVGINDNGVAPANDAILDIDISTNDMGVLLPRLTTLQRTAFNPSTESMMVYDTDTDSYWFWDGTAWKEFLTDNEWTDAGDYLIPADDTDGLTKVYETASPTSRVRAYTSGTGDYAFGDLGYYGTAIGGTSRHIGIYGNTGVGSGNVAVAGRYSAGRIGYIAGERYAIYGKFDENATGLTSSYGGYFINDNDENNASFSKYGIYGDVTASNGKKYAIYGSAQNAGDNYGVYGKAFNGTNNYGGYFEGT
ncbi:MAG: hypothetical protein U9N51_03825, partial [Bacteroidota bacterium]|nr:hypothetical protein [Bacteroidota bacterium]